jgi:hypothetical protein
MAAELTDIAAAYSPSNEYGLRRGAQSRNARAAVQQKGFSSIIRDARGIEKRHQNGIELGGAHGLAFGS